MRRQIRTWHLLAAVAALAVVFGVLARERWRWGYPLPVPYDRGNAVAWMRTLRRSYIDQYDFRDKVDLLHDLVEWRTFLGRTQAEVDSEIGSGISEDPPDGLQGGSAGAVKIRVIYAPWSLDLSPSCRTPALFLHLHFGPDGRCDEAGMAEGDGTTCPLPRITIAGGRVRPS